MTNPLKPTAIELFDPNDQKALYATYVPYRYKGAAFKMHSQRGHASSAWNNHSQCVIYKYEGGKWVEQARKDPIRRPTRCDLCGADLMQTRKVYNYTVGDRVDTLVNVGEVKLLRDERGKLRDPYEAKCLCASCIQDWA